MKEYIVYCHVPVTAKSEAEAALSLMSAIVPVIIDRVEEVKRDPALPDGALR